MAVLASKASYPSSLGMGPSQATMVSPYGVHRKPVGSGNDRDRDNIHNGAFMSPTESEFSENNDAVESIR